MQEEIDDVVKEGRRAGKTKAEIDAEIEFIKQQYTKKH